MHLTDHLQAQASDIERLTLWRRGDTGEQALGRLHAIAPDPTAGRAERDAMLPAFEGLDRWIDRSDRERLAGLVEAGALEVTQVELADAEVHDTHAQWTVRSRWTEEGSPLRRAAKAALAYLEARGVDPRIVHLHGRDVDRPDTPYFVSFGCRYLRQLPHCLTEWKGVEWIEVPRPTKTGPLLALRVTVVDPDALEANRSELAF